MNFTAQSWFSIANRGDVAAVLNPHECFDFTHLKGKEVSIDGKRYKVLGVQSFAHMAPWKKGEPIGLLVKNLEDEYATQLQLDIKPEVRTLAIIGDVHGCFDELMALLRSMAWSEENHHKYQLVFTGDLVDRGPKIAETLAFVMKYGDSVLGNHDRKLLRWLQGKASKSPLDCQTASQLHAAYGRGDFFTEQTKPIRTWLEGLPHIINLGSLGFVVHAGIDPQQSFLSQQVQTCLYGRKWYLDYDRNLGRHHVYFGHDVHTLAHIYDPKDKSDDRRLLNVIPLDAGCVFGGWLRAAVFTRSDNTPFHISDRRWHEIRAIKKYCEPHEADAHLEL